MYLRASNVTLHFRLDGSREAGADDGPDAIEHFRLGGTVETHGKRQLVRALDDVSLELHEGDRLAIVGHNGSGKSTLLKALAGIYRPQRGKVESDRPVTGLFNIALGFRQEASGYRNIMLKGLIAGKSRAQIQQAIPEIAAFTELGPYLHMPIRTYSQGMAMRLAFSIATAFSSDILLMDEWIGAGDARFSEKIVNRMNSFVESARILVLASHSTPLLRRIATRAIWLEAGRIREEGPVEDLVDRYEAEARTNARLFRAARPIDRSNIRFGLVPAELPGFKRGDKGVVGEVRWDVGMADVDAVEVMVVGADGQEKVCFHGKSAGIHATGPWLKPGVEFRLRDAASGELLATAKVLPDPTISDGSSAASATLAVSPAEIPDFGPGSKAIAGEASWDASATSAEVVELFSVDDDGSERLCTQGNPVDQYRTGPWLKPGRTLRLRDAADGTLLASTTVLPIPDGSAALRDAGPPRISVDPSELPEFRKGDKGVVGEVFWSAGNSGAKTVEVYAVGADDKPSLCFYGASDGWGTTGPWLKPGVTFQLKNSETGELLASTTIPVLAEAEAERFPARAASLTVSPSALPPGEPWQLKASGEVKWDTGDSGARAAEVYVVGRDGREMLCFSGPARATRTTKPWLRAGMVFLLKDARDGSLLATTEIATLPEGAGQDGPQAG